MTETSDSRELAQLIVQWALEKKGEDPVVMDLSGILDVTDHFVVITATSEIQARAIADNIMDHAVEAKLKPLHMEGHSAGRWILIDFVDVLAHVMLPEVREKYRLEHLWGDAELVWYDETGEPISRDNEAAG